MNEYTWICMEDEWVYTIMNERWIKKNLRMDGYMNINGKRIKITKGWMDEYWVCMNMNEEELMDGWVNMNKNG